MQKQRCVLLLGDALPCIEYDGEKIQLNQVFSKHIAYLLNEDEIAYDKTHQNNLQYLAQQFLTNNERTDLEYEIEEVYEQYSNDIPNVYRQLAKLPFHLIINTSPDDFMFRALQEEGKQAQMAYYHFAQQEHQQEIEKFSAEKPLVYHLFGAATDVSSMVFSAEDEVKFIHNILKGQPAVSNKIISHLKNVSCLFLNFNLDAWYFRVLFEGLQLAPIRTFSPQFKKTTYNTLTKDFYEKRFKFRFVNQMADDFISHFQREMNKTKNKRKLNQQKIDRKILVIFADVDEHYYEELKKALKPKTHLQLYSKADILAHENPTMRLAQMIAEVDIILPLLSSDFWAACEMEELLFRPYATKKQIIPILVRPCSWEDSPFYKDLSKLPSDKQAISVWQNKDMAYKNISKELEKMIQY